MKAIEFQGTLIGQTSISIPDEIARELPSDSQVRVILLLDNAEDSSWKSLSAERFGNTYCDADDVYESLLNAPASR
jgi:hypothetical protein